MPNDRKTAKKDMVKDRKTGKKVICQMIDKQAQRYTSKLNIQTEKLNTL